MERTRVTDKTKKGRRVPIDVRQRRVVLGAAVAVRDLAAHEHAREHEQRHDGQAANDAAYHERGAPGRDEVQEDRAALGVRRAGRGHGSVAVEQERAAPGRDLGRALALGLGPAEHDRVRVVLAHEVAHLADRVDAADVQHPAERREVGRAGGDVARERRLVKHVQHRVHLGRLAVVRHHGVAVELVEIRAQRRLRGRRRVRRVLPAGHLGRDRVRAERQHGEQQRRGDKHARVDREHELVAQLRAHAAQHGEHDDDDAQDDHAYEGRGADPGVVALEGVQPAGRLDAVAEVHEQAAGHHEAHVEQQQDHLGHIGHHAFLHRSRLVLQAPYEALELPDSYLCGVTRDALCMEHRGERDWL